MTKVIAIFNAGSSSLKFSVFRYDDLKLLHKDEIDVPDTPAGQKAALKEALDWLSLQGPAMKLHAAGHRVAHGKDYDAPVLMTPHMLSELRTLNPMAPLHQPHNLKIMEELKAHHPQLPQVACFDTAFHHTQTKLATMFAIPHHFHDKGVRRYGFHGISYEYIASELPKYSAEKAKGRVIVAHLGNGSSLCAMKNRHSVATTMGFSTLDGLMMGTRCGSLDAGVLLYMQQNLAMSVNEVSDILYHQSGLLGVSGISNDMRMLGKNTMPQAKEALDLFCYTAAQHIGSLMAVLGGLDAIIFTGGIGEHAAAIRRDICAYFGWAGLVLDERRNQTNESEIHAKNSYIAAYIIPTNEELVIARAVKKYT
jgi:acetate kinase